jgi:putative hydrolase of the HAD superfamily
VTARRETTEALLLDFGGMIDADGVHWAPRFYAAYRTAGGSLPYPAFEPLVTASDVALARLPEIRSLGFRATIDAEARLLCSQLPAAEADRIAPALLADPFHAEALAAIRRHRPVLERLAAGYRLGVVSNFTGNLDPCLTELDLRRLFTVTVDSGVLGISKPDPRIFLHALAALDTRPDRVWMIGDNFAADIRPAAVLGMRTVWIAPPPPATSGQTQPSDGIPTARVARIEELEALLPPAVRKDS